MNDNLKTWKRIIYNNINDIYELIDAPSFLVEEKNRIRFTSTIENFLVQKMQTFKNNECGETMRIGFIYGVLLPLKKHFDGVEEQTFISNIEDNYTLSRALTRIKQLNWQYYEEVTTTTLQSTPNSVARNYDGCGVGRGLKIAGTFQYYCFTCEKFVGFTEDAYWKHQDIVHNNPRIRTTTTRVRKNT